MADEKPVKDTLSPEQKAWVDAELLKAGESAVTRFKSEADETRKKSLPNEYKLEFAQDTALDPTGDREEIVAYLKAQGFSNEQAAAHIKHLEKVGSGLVSRQKNRITAQADAWANETKADPELGGANFAATQAHVERANKLFEDKLGAAHFQQFRDFVNSSGAGNHPAIVRAFSLIGRLMAEDSTTILGRSTSGGNGKTRKSDAEVFYGDKK